MEKRTLEEQEVKEHDIYTNHEQMQNGTYRYRLMASDGSGYIRTEAGNIGVWESSHYHNTIEEVIVIQKGWMAYATIVDGNMEIEIIKEGQTKLLKKGIRHNTYLSANAIAHTVKYGDIQQNDWIACPELDLITNKMTEEEILGLGK